MFDYSVCRHFCFVHTQKNRCFSYSSCATPLPCAGGYGPSGPVAWNALGAYGAPGYGAAAYPAPVAAVPATTAPAPSFKAPAPTPASKSTTGVQQAGYFYYGPANNAGYNYGTSYGYSYYGYAQAPNYWY